jgi:hypothetical protein
MSPHNLDVAGKLYKTNGLFLILLAKNVSDFCLSTSLFPKQFK